MPKSLAASDSHINGEVIQGQNTVTRFTKPFSLTAQENQSWQERAVSAQAHSF